MKANRTHRTGGFTNDDSGVSAVIGAVLMFGLFSSAFIIWSFTTLPVWIADNEEARNADVERAFTSLNSGISLLAAGNASGPIAVSVPLAADEVPLLQPAPSFGRIYYESGFEWDITFTAVPACTGGSCDHSIAGGRIAFEPINYHYLDQNIIWDGGAVLRTQADGASITSLPGFDLSVDGTTGTLTWPVVDLSGSGDTTGTRPADVVLTLDTETEVDVSAPSGSISITIGSTYCNAWEDFLSTRILLAGLDAGDASVTDCNSNDQLTLDLASATDITTWTIQYNALASTAIVGG